jgi:hypothetical protein
MFSLYCTEVLLKNSFYENNYKFHILNLFIISFFLIFLLVVFILHKNYAKSMFFITVFLSVFIVFLIILLVSLVVFNNITENMKKSIFFINYENHYKEKYEKIENFYMKYKNDKIDFNLYNTNNNDIFQEVYEKSQDLLLKTKQFNELRLSQFNSIKTRAIIKKNVLDDCVYFLNNTNNIIEEIKSQYNLIYKKINVLNESLDSIEEMIINIKKIKESIEANIKANFYGKISDLNLLELNNNLQNISDFLCEDLTALYSNGNKFFQSNINSYNNDILHTNNSIINLSDQNNYYLHKVRISTDIADWLYCIIDQLNYKAIEIGKTFKLYGGGSRLIKNILQQENLIAFGDDLQIQNNNFGFVITLAGNNNFHLYFNYSINSLNYYNLDAKNNYEQNLFLNSDSFFQFPNKNYFLNITGGSYVQEISKDNTLAKKLSSISINSNFEKFLCLNTFGVINKLYFYGISTPTMTFSLNIFGFNDTVNSKLINDYINYILIFIEKETHTIVIFNSYGYEYFTFKNNTNESTLLKTNLYERKNFNLQ